jgi:hypothetical protein
METFWRQDGPGYYAFVRADLFTCSNTGMCAMTTWFVVEGGDIEDCITTRERLS